MILKKTQEVDGTITATYNSSNILASNFDTNTNDLTITFKTGSRYKYPKVADADYVRFEIAESQGVVFNTHIKKYPFEKLDAVDPTVLIKEATEAAVAEAKAYLSAKKDNIVITLKNLVSISGPVPDGLTQDDADTMFKDSLEKLLTQITDYLK